MVGVPKSTGCAICRKRKIKCDESWPACVNCQKNGKCCPGPPARHTFKDLGPRLNANTTAADVSGFIRGTLYGAVDNVHAANSEHLSKRLTQINEKWSENGAVFHKWRICSQATDLQARKASRQNPRLPVIRHPSPSTHQALSRALIEGFSTGSMGHRMSSFGSFMLDVPKRLGHSVALDAAVACLVNAHAAMIRRKKATDIADPKLYLNAVQALQMTLEDPVEGKSDNTLCATILLGFVEAMAGPRRGNNYLSHAGGAGRLMELQGPERYKDTFSKQMLRCCRGGVIMQAIYQRKPCFLASQEWRDVAFNLQEMDFEESLQNGILTRLAEFPALLREFRDLDLLAAQPQSHESFINFDDDLTQSIEELFAGDSFPSNDFIPIEDFSSCDPFTSPDVFPSSSPRTNLLNKLRNLKSSLCSLGYHLNARLADGTAAIELPSIEEDNPLPTAFHFTNWRGIVAYNCFWALLILTNKLIMRILPPFDPNYYSLEEECRNVSYEICKTWEDAWAGRPIGAYHTGFSFVMAYEWVRPDVQTWIISRMNALIDSQLIEPFRWRADIILMLSRRLSGDGPDLMHANGLR